MTAAQNSQTCATDSIDRVRVVEIAPKILAKTEGAEPQMQITPVIPQVIVQKADITDAMFAAFSALGFAVSARVLLFLSLVGTFVLAVLSMMSQTKMSAVIVTLFCIGTVIPLCILEFQKND
jgi:hypothetical protein